MPARPELVEGRAVPSSLSEGARGAPRARSLALAAALALAALPAAVRAEAPIPRLTGPVVDAAGLLDGAAVRRLDALARAARAAEGGRGVQLQYLVVRSLEGEPIEDYSIRVAEAWKIGTKGKDDGVLVTVAVEDRAVRIEVGGGLEGGLTDAQSSRIIRNTIAPAFRAGRFGDGLHDAGVQILGALGALPSGVRERGDGRGVTGLPAGAGLVFPAFLVLSILANVLRGFGGRRRRSLWWGGGPWIGGGGGFGGLGGGGGSWGGGGGGFSGGGASGRW